MKITVCINAHFSKEPKCRNSIVLYWILSVVVTQEIRRILVFSCFMITAAGLVYWKPIYSERTVRLTIDLHVPAVLYCGEGKVRKVSFASDDIAVILLLGGYPQGAHSHVTVRTRLQS